jgi:predicted dehydrogenase
MTQGGSGWGANAHVPALRLLPDYELKAVCTAHADTAQASKEKFGGEFDELAARVTTRIEAWKSTETGQDVPVDSPDSISVAGVLKSGAEVSVQVAAMPFNPSGTRLEIYGREGTMVISAARGRCVRCGRGL